LHEPSVDLLDRAGLHVVDGADRKLYADTVDPDVTILYARATDIPEYVSDGAADIAKAFVEYVEGTYVEGVIPGYEYADPVAGLRQRARQTGEADSA
jgi:ATP phosphoribosyltransferase